MHFLCAKVLHEGQERNCPVKKTIAAAFRNKNNHHAGNERQLFPKGSAPVHPA